MPATRSSTPVETKNKDSTLEGKEPEDEEKAEGGEGGKEEEEDSSVAPLIRHSDPGSSPSPVLSQHSSLKTGGSLRGSFYGSKDLRIMLLGDRGSGKSTVGNIILKKKVFSVPSYPDPETQTCQKKTRKIKGRNITVMDTPGLSNSDLSDQSHTPEMVRWLTECAPGPHAFVIVLNVERYQQGEGQEVWNIQEWFGENAFNYAVVLFTHGDKLGGSTIKKFVKKNDHLKEIVQKCGGRCHVLNGKSWSKNGQVQKLLKTIELIVKQNGGSYYTNEMLQAVAASVDEEAAKITTKPRLSYADVGKQALNIVRKKLLHLFVGATTGAVLGAIFGISVKIVKYFLDRLGPSLIGYVAALGIPTLVGGAVGGGIIGGALTGGVVAGFLITMSIGGAVVGGATGANAAMQATSVKEAMQLAAKAVIDKEKAALKKSWQKGVVRHIRSSPEQQPTDLEPIPEEGNNQEGNSRFEEALSSLQLKPSTLQLRPKLDKFRRYSLWLDYSSTRPDSAHPGPAPPLMAKTPSYSGMTRYDHITSFDSHF